MKDPLRECIEGKKTTYTPIWFMRQAGRYLPEFKEIRKHNPDFIKLCLNPNLVSEITGPYSFEDDEETPTVELV